MSALTHVTESSDGTLQSQESVFYARTSSAPVSKSPRKDQPNWYSGATGEAISGRVEFRPDSRKPLTGTLDRSALLRATELTDNIESESEDELALTFESLRCAVSILWSSAANASIHHQDVLSLISSAITSDTSMNRDRAAALRGAFKDLASPLLTAQHVDVIQSQFIDVGYNPLEILSEFLDDGSEPTSRS